MSIFGYNSFEFAYIILLFIILLIGWPFAAFCGFTTLYKDRKKMYFIKRRGKLVVIIFLGLCLIQFSLVVKNDTHSIIVYAVHSK